MGSLFTEGQHYYIDKQNPKWKEAFQTLLLAVECLEENKDSAMTVLRDFEEDAAINEFLHSMGFIKISMPESCIVLIYHGPAPKGYLATLSARSRKHFKKDIQAYEKYFEIEYRSQASEEELEVYYQLFENVRAKNFDVNTFSFRKLYLPKCRKTPTGSSTVLYCKEYATDKENRTPVAVMFCYKNMEHTYVPPSSAWITGYAEFQIYRQMLYQTIHEGKSA